MSGSNPPNAVVLLDDTSDAFYNPQAWSTRKNEYHYNGGQWVNDGAAESSISCAFEGTSITFYGRNQTQSSWTAELIYDDDVSGEVVTMSSDRPMIYDFLTSKTLPEGSHTLQLKNMRATSNHTGEQPKFDYAYVVPGMRTNVMGKLLMVDDGDASISYSGGWEPTINPLANQLEPSPSNEYAVPHREGTHVSRTNGDSFSMDFVGTSIALGGVLLNDGTVGRFTLNIHIDDQPSRTRVITTDGNPQPYQPRIFPNYNFYTSDRPLSHGPHTVKVEVTDFSGNLPFILDYVLYTAAFESFEALAAGPSEGGQDKPTETPKDQDPSTEEEKQEAKPSSLGAIVGGVVGGAVFAALIILLLFLCLRRRRRKQYKTRQAFEIDTQPTPLFLNERPNSGSSETFPLTMTRSSDVTDTTRGMSMGMVGYSSKMRRMDDTPPSRSSPLSRSTGESSSSNPNSDPFAVPSQVGASRLFESTESEYSEGSRSTVTGAMSDAPPPPYEPRT